MSQPVWKLLANLGDANPIEHGGLFVFEDETGVYTPQMELLRGPEDVEDEDSVDGWEVFRWEIPRCTYVNGVLSDNSYHPTLAAWFANKIERIASSVGRESRELIQDFCAEDTLQRARAYQDLVGYYGPFELDQDQLNLTREEAEKRIAPYLG